MSLKNKSAARSGSSARSGRSARPGGLGSIARSINFEFWLREFSHLLLLDVVLIGTVAAVFLLWCEQQVPDGVEIASRQLMHRDALENAAWVLTASSGKIFPFRLLPFLSLCKIPAIALAVLEGLFLFGNLFSVGTVRRKMKPLNEIAIRTDELTRTATEAGTAGRSSGGRAAGGNAAARDNAAASGSAAVSGAAVNLKTMEKAISRLNPDKPDARVVTGDKELQSLEIAINNLLDRMRESHRQQERFVSDASHELRTPIAVIQGYVNMLDRWGKDDEQILRESIEALKNESEHMKNLVEQLLFLARGDSGRNTLHFEECDLVEMVRDVMEESAMIDEKHQYRFETAGLPVSSANTSGQPGMAVPGNSGVNDAAGQMPQSVMVQCDPAMLKQSMRIFVQNAAKYSNEGDVITLKAGRAAPAHRRNWDASGHGSVAGAVPGNAAVRPFYSVQDEGVGMQSSEVIHVFERFYRSDNARNSAQGGTGLGLSIAKWIVDAHGGDIEILTRPEFGTRITVRL